MHLLAGGTGERAAYCPAVIRAGAKLWILVLVLFVGGPGLSAQIRLDVAVPGPTASTRASSAVAVNYSGYLVAWAQGRGETTDPGVYAARVDPLGNVLDPFGILISQSAGEQSTCKVAALADGFLVAWSAPRGNSATDWDVLAARVGLDGVVQDATPLPVCAMAGSIQNSPAVGANGANYLVVWADSRSTGIYGCIVTPDGRLSPTNGFSICTAAYEQYMPSVTAFGTNYLVVWQDYRNATASVYSSDIYGARVSGSGVLMDAAGIPICRRANSQYQPAVGANSGGWLVVWEDYDIAGNDILGARVGADGVVLDTNALVIARAANAQCTPAVSGNFADFLVTWQDYRGSPGTNFAAAMRATRLRGDGAVTHPDGVALSNGPGEQWCPALAGFWDDFLVVWQDFRNNAGTTLADIYGAAVESGRDLLPYPDGIISVSANAQIGPRSARLGTNFLVVWADNRNWSSNGWDIFGMRLDQHGLAVDAEAIPICTSTNNQLDPVVAAQGTNWLVVWSDFRNTVSNVPAADIFGALIDANGVVTPAGGFGVCSATNDQTRPTVCALGGGYLVAWQDARNSLASLTRLDIYGTRLSAAGEILDGTNLVLCTNPINQIAPAAAGNGGMAAVAWTDFRPGPSASDIYLCRVTTEGSVLDSNGRPVCTVTGAQSTPTVATDGSGFFLAWTDARSTGTAADIYAARITPEGAVQPTNGFPIRAVAGQQSAPALAFNGLDYLIAWHEVFSSLSNSFGILGTGVTPSGKVFSGGPWLITTNSSNPLAPSVSAGADGRFLVFSHDLDFQVRRAVADLMDLEAIPRLEASAPAGNGLFEFLLRCAPGRNYVLQSSEDLQTWAPFTEISATNFSIWLSDPVGARQRFYRAFLLP